jgi:homoserine O-acetyltransferase
MTIFNGRTFRSLFCVFAFVLGASTASAQPYPDQQQGVWIAKNFQFHTGEVFPKLRLGYTTLGKPTGIPVLVLHGTAGTGSGMITNKNFSGELFGPGQPLDANIESPTISSSILSTAQAIPATLFLRKRT